MTSSGGDCPTTTFESRHGNLVFEAVARDCHPEDNDRVINGYHGTYRTLDDVEDPTDVAHVDTDGLGDAVVFTQHYAEYTNFTSDWDEPVAIVTLDAPESADYPTLVVRSEKAELSRADFTEVVRSMREPY